ncbi:MAG: pyridoxamine 5'-phosphate oxidase [Agarilytica sp.]
MDLEDLRREYLMGGLKREDLDDDPYKQFERWMSQALEFEIKDPTAMSLATVDADGQPSQRLVLLKHADEKGFVFFTNYRSQKASDIEQNAKVSLLFPWHTIERQVKIMGQAEKIPTSESLKYFLTRPRESQIAAWASKQSHALTSRGFLLNQVEALRQKFAHGDIPLPDFWGGYRIRASKYEFWQGGANRLHDRFQYTQMNGVWEVERLAP